MHRGSSYWLLGKYSSLTVWLSTGSGCGPRSVIVHNVVEQRSLMRGLTFSLPCVESGVGLNDPYRSLPTQDIL